MGVRVVLGLVGPGFEQMRVVVHVQLVPVALALALGAFRRTVICPWMAGAGVGDGGGEAAVFAAGEGSQACECGGEVDGDAAGGAFDLGAVVCGVGVGGVGYFGCDLVLADGVVGGCV